MHDFHRFNEVSLSNLLKYAKEKIGQDFEMYLPYYDLPRDLNRKYVMNVILS